MGSDKIETALQLLFLLMFALVAAGYVLKKGLEERPRACECTRVAGGAVSCRCRCRRSARCVLTQDPTRPTYKTLLRCTLIITSVAPCPSKLRGQG